MHHDIINVSQLDRLVDAQGRIQVLQLTLHNYKHKNSGPPFVIFIYPERSCCPVQLILRADVCKYRPEVGKINFLKNPPKIM